MKDILKLNEIRNLKSGLLFANIFAFFSSCVLYMTFFDTLKYWFVYIIFYVILFCLCVSTHNVEQSSSIAVIGKFDWLLFIFVFLILICGQLLYWFSYYPGGFNLDAYGQWDQVHGFQQINNWHPVMTTLLYWIITRIYDEFWFCILVQLIVFSVVVSKLLVELHQYGINKKTIFVCSVFFALNPAIGMSNVCLIKDVPFTIAIVFLISLLLKVYTSNGLWIKKKIHSLYFVIIMICMSLIRHNSIFFVVPLIVLLILTFSDVRRTIIVLSLISMIMVILIEGPVFKVLNVKQHENVVGETVGIPMGILACSLLMDKEHIPEDVSEFLLDIASLDEWSHHYIVGEWDSCKWEFGGTELFQGEDITKFFDMTIRTIINCPETSYLAFRENTRVAWQFWGYSYWQPWVYIEENRYGIVENRNVFCKTITDKVLDCSNSLIGNFFVWNVGVYTIVFLLVSFTGVVQHRERILVFTIPSISYLILTMFMLSGPSYRYFYCISVIGLPVLMITTRIIHTKSE